MVFGNYRLDQLLGEGGMGTVYKVLHLKLEKVMALKVLRKDLLMGDAVARFEREMKAVGKVVDPHVVQAFDAGDIDGQHYLAMEYVEGTDLQKLVRTKGPLSVTSACRAMRQAALALEAAHAVGLVHRDVKPSNLMADRKGKIRLLDLGLALLSSAPRNPDGSLTAAGDCFGTPDYMAPEQWKDSHTADARTDLYALGCTLYFLLTGRAPFETVEPQSTFRKMQAHLAGALPDLQAANPSVPTGVAAIFTRLIAKPPAERFQMAGAVVEALEPFTRKGAVDMAAPAPPRQQAPLYAPGEETVDTVVVPRHTIEPESPGEQTTTLDEDSVIPRPQRLPATVPAEPFPTVSPQPAPRHGPHGKEPGGPFDKVQKPWLIAASPTSPTVDVSA